MIYLFGTPEQLEIATCTARNMALFAGRRWGKNFGVRNRSVIRAKNPQFRGCFAAPVYAQCVKEFNFYLGNPGMRRFIKKYGKQPFPYIIFKTGAEWQFRSLDRPDNIRTEEYDEIVIDEIQNVSEDVINTVLRPCLTARIGSMLIMGQFRGQNWYYEEFFLKGQNDPSGRYKSWRFPSITGIRFQTPEGRAALEEEMARVPRLVREQEYDCIPAANKASVFPHDAIERAKRGTWTPHGSAGNCVIGLDLGKFSDPGALVVMQAEAREVIYSEVFPLKQDHAKSAMRVRMVAERFGFPAVVMDSTGGATGGRHDHDEFTRFYENTVPNVRPYIWTMANKMKMVSQLSLALEKNEIAIAPENSTLLRQLAGYEYRKRPNGSYEFCGPSGKDDDLVAALMMAYEGTRRGWFGGTADSAANLGFAM